MLNYLKELLTALHIPVTDFNLGYFFALAVVGFTLLGLFLIRIILKIIFRKKRCHNIVIKSSGGDAFISATAIMSVIKTLEKEFTSLTINKVNLFRYRQRPFLEIYLDFDASKGGLPSHADAFKQRVIESLDSLFGIRNIKRVHLFLRHVQLSNLNLQTKKITLEPPQTSAKDVEIPVKTEVDPKVDDKKE